MGGVTASSPLPEESPSTPQHSAIPTDHGKPADNQKSPSDTSNVPLSNVTQSPNDPGLEGEEGSEERPGLIREDGSINWDCPCLGGMATGPCGPEFKAAFSCFHYSTAEQKGSDCLEPFMAMQSCFQKYPEIFGPKEGEDDLDDPVPDAEKGPNDDKKLSTSDGNALPDSEKTSVKIKS